MKRPTRILVDTGILLAYYSARDRHHRAVVAFFESCMAQLVTSPICIAETLWLLGSPQDQRVLGVQTHLLQAVSQGAIEAVALHPQDYARVAELNTRYADLPGDFADLSLVVLSERLEIPAILSLDSDFDVYRRYRREPFERVALPEGC